MPRCGCLSGRTTWDQSTNLHACQALLNVHRQAAWQLLPGQRQCDGERRNPERDGELEHLEERWYGRTSACILLTPQAGAAPPACVVLPRSRQIMLVASCMCFPLLVTGNAEH